MAAKLQPDLEQLPSYQHMLIGLVSGAMGPFSNAPIDTIKTRKDPFSYLLQLTLTPHTATGLQKSPAAPSQSAFQRISAIALDMWRQEGYRAFYKGITPRVLRVAPGQAIVFAVYERVSKTIEQLQGSGDVGYSE